MKIKKQVVILTILALLLVVPSFVYFYITRGFNTFIKLEILGQEGHKISDFSFTNQNNIKISNEDFKDKIYIANFFLQAAQQYVL